jgi:hypothetical protein
LTTLFVARDNIVMSTVGGAREVGLVVALVLGGCSSQKGAGAGANLPLVTPPVRAAAPVGFGGDGARTLRSRAGFGPTVHVTSLDSSDIRERFFTSGPTNIFALLAAIDDRIAGLNAQAAERSEPCLDQEPIAYTITPFGSSITLYAQCFQSIGSSGAGDPGLIQFGQRDGLTYYYAANGAERMAAILTPLGSTPPPGDAGADARTVGPGAGTYSVEAWTGVGYLNTTACGDHSGFDDCSYGVIRLSADSSRSSFEMAVAGIGFGYCGAQLRSDGTSVYGVGSGDMATTCAPRDTFCVAARDVATPSMCEPPPMFALPALGRVTSTGPNAGGPGAHTADAVWAASQYPGGADNTIMLDGTASDSLQFGPVSPTPGVGAF